MNRKMVEHLLLERCEVDTDDEYTKDIKCLKCGRKIHFGQKVIALTWPNKSAKKFLCPRRRDRIYVKTWMFSGNDEGEIFFS